MNNDYEDIRSRIAESPAWWDESGAPRYGLFEPRKASNIYAHECVLMRIECQACQHEFDVCLTWDTMAMAMKRPSLAEQVRAGTIHYGDPPNVRCCPSGPTMNSVPRRVCEFWEHKAPEYEWKRVPELEVCIKADWDETP